MKACPTPKRKHPVLNMFRLQHCRWKVRSGTDHQLWRTTAL